MSTPNIAPRPRSNIHALMIVALGLAIGLICFASGPTYAHKGASGLVKQRMDDMKRLKDAMKALKSAVTAAKPPSPKFRARHATAIARIAQQMAALFPNGSNHKPSEALDRIWTDWPSFKAEISKLEAGATMLANAGSATEFVASFRALGASCQSCHKNYRIEK